MISAFLVLAGFSFAAEKKPGPGDAALVNGKPITVLELDKSVDGVLRQLASSGRTPDAAQMGAIRKNVLEDLINVELLAQEGRKKGIKVENAAVAGRIQALKSSFPDEKKYNEALSKDQVTESDLKARIEKRLLVEELLNNEVLQKISVSPEESKAFYDSHPESFKQPERVHAAHILIKVEPKAPESDKKKARKSIEDIQKRLKKGEDFASLAKQYSDCPSKEKGGDLGFLERGRTVKPFEDVAFSLKPGETSGIVETEFGFHIVRVIEKKSESVVPYQEAEQPLQKHLKDTKAQAEVGRYIEGLKTNSKVERNLTEPVK